MLAAGRGPAGRATAGPPGAQAAMAVRPAARPGPARTATDRSSRATPASPDRRDDRGAAAGRSAGATSNRAGAARPPPQRRLRASLAARGRRAARARSGSARPRPIALPAAVGPDLARHGRGCPAEPPRDQPEGLARPQATADLLALGDRESERGPTGRPGLDPAERADRRLDVPFRPTDAGSNVIDPLPRRHPATDLGSLSLCRPMPSPTSAHRPPRSRDPLAIKGDVASVT